MREVLIALMGALDTHLSSEKIKKSIYEDIIPALAENDFELAGDLCEEDDVYAKVYTRYLKENYPTEDEPDISIDDIIDES